MKYKFVLVLPLLLLSLLSQSVSFTSAQKTITLNPIADSYVDAGEPNSNYGASSSLDVWPYSAAFIKFGYITYLKFDLETIPAGATITSAWLRLYLTWGLSETAEIGVHFVSDNTWEELKITWNNKPSYYPTPAYVNDTVAIGDEWYEWEITSEVSKSATLLSLALVSTKGGIATFDSREVSHKPTLIVQYTVPDSAPPSISDLKINPVEPTVEDEVAVTTKVIDDESGVKWVILSYTDKGTTWKEVNMEYVGDETYKSLIPQQKSGTTVEYSVKTQDNSGNEAQSNTLSFTVKKPTYYSELSDKYNALQSEHNTVKDKLESAKSELDRAHSVLQKSQTDLSKALSDMKTLQDELDSTEAELSEVKDTVETTKSELEKTKTDLTTTQSDLQDLQSEHTTLNKDYGDLKQSKEAVQSEHENLKADYERVKQEQTLLQYVFLLTTVIFLLTTIYFARKKKTPTT